MAYSQEHMSLDHYQIDSGGKLTANSVTIIQDEEIKSQSDVAVISPRKAMDLIIQKKRKDKTIMNMIDEQLMDKGGPVDIIEINEEKQTPMSIESIQDSEEHDQCLQITGYQNNRSGLG